MKVRKTRQNKRGNYKYVSATGEKTILKPGENGITEEMIRELHRADDREVENNLKNMHAPMTKKEKEEIRIWEKEHPGEKYPNEWILSLDAMVSEDDGESTIDRDAFLKDQNASRFYDPCSDAATDRLREIIHDLPPRQKKVIRLIWYVGYSQTEAAKLLHCSKVNICKLQRVAFETIRNDETLRKIIYRQG